MLVLFINIQFECMFSLHINFISQLLIKY